MWYADTPANVANDDLIVSCSKSKSGIKSLIQLVNSI